MSVAFAQIAPAQDNQQEAETQIETEQTINNQDEKERKQVELSQLPQETQDAFNNGVYSEMEVLAIYEVDAATTEIEGEAQESVYEFELAQAVEATDEGTTDEGTTDEGLAGIETERVSERQPDIVLYIDEKGQVVKEKNLDELEEE